MTNASQSMNIEPPHKAIRCGGLQYNWHPAGFLSYEEACYGLDRLWALVAGEAGWTSDVVLGLPAIERPAVDALFALSPGTLPWIPLTEVLPAGYDLELDTTRLPELCRVSADGPSVESDRVWFPFDLVAATFVFLSRWEERQGRLPKDARGNTRETATFIARQNLIERPVLDEWAMVLRAWLQVQQPRWRAQPPSFRYQPTHDIDHLFRYPSFRCVARRVAGTLVRTRNPLRTVHTFGEAIRSVIKPQSDPCFRILRDLADRNEKLGEPGVFFFMSAQASKFDDGYDSAAPLSRQLLAELAERGHVVGWHPGYFAAEDKSLFFAQAKYLKQAVSGDFDTVRMHYLRWRHHTLEWLEDLGIKYEHTWGMNDGLGFAQGTARPFPLWDPTHMRSTAIIETPFLLQDGPLAILLQADSEAAHQTMADIIARTKRVNGVFSFLIHNKVEYGTLSYSTLADAVYGSLSGS